MRSRNIVFVVIAIFIGLIYLFNVSGILKSYKIPSSSSEPNLKVGSRILGSSLKKPERLDFAYFKFSDSLEGWTIVKRLIALPGDTLKCKKGNYYVNGKNIDENINLRFSYKMLPKIFDTYIKGKIENTEYYRYYNSDSVVAMLDDSFVQNLPVELDRNYNKNRTMLSSEIFDRNVEWTSSDFGPIIIPENKYFFSGDNRDNSIDSRYRGYVDRENILGTVLINF